MCIANSEQAAIFTKLGRRTADGTFTPDRKLLPGEHWADRNKPTPTPRATDVPLGDGMLSAARLSILQRREKIRQAVESAQ